MKPYLLLLSLLCFFLSCKKHSSQNSNPGNGFDPNKPSFRVGTVWKYQRTSYTPGGSISSVDTFYFQITKDTIINTSKYFVTTGNYYPNGYYFSNQATGYFEFDKNLSRENLFFKNPASPQDAYTSQLLSFPPSTCIIKFDATVKNGDTTSVINAINYTKLITYHFNYYSLSCQSLPAYSDLSFSTKMGLRLTELFYASGHLSSKDELISFTY